MPKCNYATLDLLNQDIGTFTVVDNVILDEAPDEIRHGTVYFSRDFLTVEQPLGENGGFRRLSP